MRCDREYAKVSGADVLKRCLAITGGLALLVSAEVMAGEDPSECVNLSGDKLTNNCQQSVRVKLEYNGEKCTELTTLTQTPGASKNLVFCAKHEEFKPELIKIYQLTFVADPTDASDCLSISEDGLSNVCGQKIVVRLEKQSSCPSSVLVPSTFSMPRYSMAQIPGCRFGTDIKVIKTEFLANVGK